MYKNYFYLFRCINELNPLLRDLKIVEAYTQERDKLFFKIPLPGKPDFHLSISTNAQNPFIGTKDEHRKAKKNTISFFAGLLPCRIESISIASGDRIARIVSDKGIITIFFRGNKSNVFFTGADGIFLPFRKIDEEQLKSVTSEINGLSYIITMEEAESLINYESGVSILKKIPFIGKDLIREAELRGNDFPAALKRVINEVLTGKIRVYFDEFEGRPVFAPSTFSLKDVPEDIFESDSYNEALNRYFSLGYSRTNIRNLRKEIESFLAKEIESLSFKLNNLRARLDAGTKEKIYHHYADLLLANLSMLRKGMKEIELEDYSGGGRIKIVLNEKLSPSQNIDRYYEKSRGEKIEYAKSEELMRTSEKYFGHLTKVRARFETAEDQTGLLQIKKDLKMTDKGSQQHSVTEKSNFRHFLLEGRYHIYVGKDSRNNDQLTTQFAKQNDFWFHARSVSGSHVVLRVDNTKEAVPKNILMKTASLAAFYSKAKSAGLVPVSYTLKKYVSKNSRLEVGQVTITKEKVLLVKPEIPKDCSVVDE